MEYRFTLTNPPTRYMNTAEDITSCNRLRTDDRPTISRTSQCSCLPLWFTVCISRPAGTNSCVNKQQTSSIWGMQEVNHMSSTPKGAQRFLLTIPSQLYNAIFILHEDKPCVRW